MDTHYGDAADDGESVHQLSKFRARVEDRGNEKEWIPGIQIPRAGVDPDSVQLFVLDNEFGALVVDSIGFALIRTATERNALHGELSPRPGFQIAQERMIIPAKPRTLTWTVS